MLKQLAENIWVYEQPHRLGGINIGARMTVVRDDDSDLWLHSPIDSAQLLQEIEALGRVRALVAPNLGHYVGLGEAMETFPDAEAFAPPDVAKKYDKPMRLPEFSGGESLRARRVRGSRVFDETVFLHGPSQTLIITDLAMNLRHLRRGERVWARLVGIPPRLGTTRLTKLIARDHEAMREATQDILGWDFERIVLSHGDLIEENAKAKLRQALRWL